MTIGIIVPYWSLHLQSIGFSPVEIGELMAILLITKVVAPNIWATIADNIKARTGNSLGLLKIATLMTLIIFSSLFWLQSYWAVALAMLGFCFFWNACLPQLEAATMHHLSGDKHRYGTIRLWGSIGFIGSVLIVGALIDLWGTQVIQPAGMFSMFVLLLASFWFTKQTINNQVIKTNKQSHIPVTQLLNPLVIAILTLCFFMQLSHAPFYTFFSIYLESYDYSKTMIGWLWAVGVLCEVVVFIVSYRLLKSFKLGYLLSVTFALAAIRWLLLAMYPQQLWLVLLTQTMHAATYGLYHCVMIQLVDRFFVGRYQIRGQALYSSVTFGLGGAVGSIVSGYIWSLYGPRSLFLSAACLMGLVMIVSLFLVSRLETHDYTKHTV